MVFTAGMIGAEDALKWGLVNDVCPLSELLAKAEKMATKILANSPMAIGSAIRSINAQGDKSKDGFQVEIDEFGKCFGTPEFKEGTGAFIEKRKPNFR
jgi:enoyl-CoA hydratase